MNVMMNSRVKPGGGGAPAIETARLMRLELELAVELGVGSGKSFNDAVQQAVESVGGDLLFVLPGADGDGTAALLRLVEDDGSRILQVRKSGSSFAVTEEEHIDAAILGFARASIDVMERLRDDQRVLAPLASAAH